VYTISTTLSAIHQLLTDPRPDSPLNVDVAALLRDGDIAGWESVVRYWTGEERWRGPGNANPAAR
jgi:peroxin-4